VFLPSCTAERDVVGTDFFATAFPPVPVDFNTTKIHLLKDITKAYLTTYNTLQTLPSADLVGKCTDRFSVIHCHVLAHVSESSEGIEPTCPASRPAPRARVFDVLTLRFDPKALSLRC
jgi:hypothetical protein